MGDDERGLAGMALMMLCWRENGDSGGDDRRRLSFPAAVVVVVVAAVADVDRCGLLAAAAELTLCRFGLRPVPLAER